jgi:hypothetical protein
MLPSSLPVLQGNRASGLLITAGKFVVLSIVSNLTRVQHALKVHQIENFFLLRFWNLRYFFVSYVKILRFYKKQFLIGPLLGEVRFFRVVLGLRGMKKNFELGQNFFYLFFNYGP